MKNILFLVLFLSSFLLSAQDTVRVPRQVTVYDTYITVHKTDTICPPAIDTTKKSLLRMMYIQNADLKIGVSAKEDYLIGWAKLYGFNYFHPYDLQNIFGTLARENQLAAFVLKCRNNGIYVGCVGGSSSFFSSKMGAYNRSRTNPLEKLTWINLENEYWLQANLSSAMTIDSTYLGQDSITAKSLGIQWYGQYIGWNPAPIDKRAPKVLAKLSNYFTVHYYRTTLDTTYGKYRVTDLNRESAALNLVKPFICIHSAEPAFYQAKLAPATFNEVDQMYSVFCKQFPNLKYYGQLWFTDDYMMTKLPGPTQAARLSFGVYNPNFVNQTTPKHLLDAVEK